MAKTTKSQRTPFIGQIDKPKDMREFSSKVRHDTDKLWFSRWVQNSYDNRELIATHMEGHVRLAHMPILLKLENKHKGVPAVILGSGPSLDDNVELLKDWEGIIFCGPTQVQSLKRIGLKPDYLVPVDANSQINRFVQSDVIDYTGTTLLATPVMDHEFLKNWNSNRAYYLPYMGGTKQQKDDDVVTVKEFFEKYPAHPNESIDAYFTTKMQHFVNDVLEEAYHNPKMFIEPRIKNGGNGPTQSITIANYLGCDPMLLMGCDCCFSKTRTRALTWQFERSSGTWYPWYRNDIYEDRKAIMLNGKPTTHGMIIDMRNYILSSIYENMQVIEIGDGALNYFPKVKPEEFLKIKDWKPYYKTKEQRQKEAAEWTKKFTGQELILVEG